MGRYHIEGDAFLLAQQDESGVWLLARVGGAAEVRLGSFRLLGAAVPVTSLASLLTIDDRSAGRVERFDLSGLALAPPALTLRLADMLPVRDNKTLRYAVVRAGLACGTEVALSRPATTEEDHNLRALVNSVADLWVPAAAVAVAKAFFEACMSLFPEDLEEVSVVVAGMASPQVVRIAASESLVWRVVPPGHTTRSVDGVVRNGIRTADVVLRSGDQLVANWLGSQRTPDDNSVFAVRLGE